MMCAEKILSILQCMCKNIQDQPSWIDHVYFIDHSNKRPAPITDGQGSYIYFRRINISSNLKPVLNNTEVIGYTEIESYRAVVVFDKTKVNRLDVPKCALSAIQACSKCIRGEVKMYWDPNEIGASEVNYFKGSISSEEKTKFLNSLGDIDLIAFEFTLGGDITISKCNCQPCSDGGGLNDYYPPWL